MIDEDALGEALRELFAAERSEQARPRRRRQPAHRAAHARAAAVTDHKELAAAVNFQAQDQVPMPLNNAVLDFHPLASIDTPAGPRQRVVLVAAQRDMVERLLAAVRRAGLTPEGVDLSAFALIRSLYRPEAEQTGRVLYLNVDGLTNLAIAEGTSAASPASSAGASRGWPSELAERRGIALADARALLAAVDLSVPQPHARAARRLPRRRRRRAARRPAAPRRTPSGSCRERREELEAARRRNELRGARDGRPGARASPLRRPRRRTSGRCSRTASARSPARSATRSTSTAPRRAAARSPTSCSAAPRRTSPVSPRPCRPRLGVEVRSGRGQRRRQAAWTASLAAPPGGGHRPGRHGGAAMRAVNLIPGDQRSGSSVGAGRSEGGAYAVLGCSSGSPCWRVLYGKADHEISSRKAQAGSVSAEAHAGAGRGQRSWLPTRASSRCANSAHRRSTSLVDSRFDWAHAFHEFGRVLPAQTADRLARRLDRLRHDERLRRRDPAAAPASLGGVTSATPPGSVPTFTLTRLCNEPGRGRRRCSSACA